MSAPAADLTLCVICTLCPFHGDQTLKINSHVVCAAAAGAARGGRRSLTHIHDKDASAGI